MSSTSWDNYWQSTSEESTFSGFGPQSSVLKSHWRQMIEHYLKNDNAGCRLLDVAAGNGTVTAQIAEIDQQNALTLYASDYSESACRELKTRVPEAIVFAADAANLPCSNGQFDLIVSQFGVEYAGFSAIEEALRLLKDDGRLVLVMHYKTGAIHQECLQNYLATKAFLESEILLKAKPVFEVAEQLMKSQATQDDFRHADAVFSESVESCKKVFQRFGTDVTAGLLWKVFTDLGYMFGHIETYDKNEVLQWLSHSFTELTAYCARMQSMDDAALDLEDIQTLCDNLGFPKSSAEIMMGAPDAGKQEPIGWVLDVYKSANG